MERITLNILVVVLFGFAAIQPAAAQYGQLSEEARLSLITILPGDAPEELFGHSAVRVRDPIQGLDLFFNYGTFQFDAYFLPKFIYGDLNYFLSVTSTQAALRYYEQRKRPVIEQLLNLDIRQRQALYHFLMENAEQENRYYQYDFLFDNCSTRIRDALVEVFGEGVEFPAFTDQNPTFRELINRYTHHKPFTTLGINLLLGSGLDEPAGYREQMFLPDYLEKAFDKAVIHSEGVEIPLVASKELILGIEEADGKNEIPWADITTWTLFLAGLLITIKNYRQKKRYERWFDIVWILLVAVPGLLITFLWFISLHNVTANNLNLLWAWPSHLFIIYLLLRMEMNAYGTKIYLLLHTVCCLGVLIVWNYWEQELHTAIIPFLLLIMLRSCWMVFGNFKERK